MEPPTPDSVATFSIGVTFRPRTIDPGEISHRLGLEPTWHWRAGERVRNPNGTLRPSRERYSRWSLIETSYDRREDDVDEWNEAEHPLAPTLNARLTAFLEPFVRQRSYVREVVADSSMAWLDLDFPGQFHFGFLLSPTTLAVIADLGFELGIEIFPNSAS